jgi:hypothetical protein
VHHSERDAYLVSTLVQDVDGRDRHRPNADRAADGKGPAQELPARPARELEMAENSQRGYEREHRQRNWLKNVYINQILISYRIAIGACRSRLA